jgi:hypothetical protein
MPRVAEFAGIVIAMYFGDHNPPHFHALYGDDEAALAIDTLDVIAGTLPRRQLKQVREWAAANRALLVARWNELR